MTISKEEDGVYKWTNRAGVTWTLYQEESGDNMLRVGEDCPYFDDGYTTATFNKTGIVGPWGKFYSKFGRYPITNIFKHRHIKRQHGH